jgi:hypothetical protein
MTRLEAALTAYCESYDLMFTNVPEKLKTAMQAALDAADAWHVSIEVSKIDAVTAAYEKEERAGRPRSDCIEAALRASDLYNLREYAKMQMVETTLPIERRVTDKMRRAAIDYWKSLHPKDALIPIGEINGIIYAALGAEDPTFEQPDALDVARDPIVKMAADAWEKPPKHFSLSHLFIKHFSEQWRNTHNGCFSSELRDMSIAIGIALERAFDERERK